MLNEKTVRGLTSPVSTPAPKKDDRVPPGAADVPRPAKGKMFLRTFLGRRAWKCR